MAKFTKKQMKRREMKRARKEANRKKYEEFKRRGVNGKRAVRNRQKKSLVADHKHATSNCGNPACPKCFPNLNPKLTQKKRERLNRTASDIKYF